MLRFIAICSLHLKFNYQGNNENCREKIEAQIISVLKNWGSTAYLFISSDIHVREIYTLQTSSDSLIASLFGFAPAHLFTVHHRGQISLYHIWLVAFGLMTNFGLLNQSCLVSGQVEHRFSFSFCS